MQFKDQEYQISSEISPGETNNIWRRKIKWKLTKQIFRITEMYTLTSIIGNTDRVRDAEVRRQCNISDFIKFTRKRSIIVIIIIYIITVIFKNVCKNGLLFVY